MLGLGQIAELLTKFESRATYVYPSQCKRVRHRNAQCTLCADHCSAGAITFRESLQVDQERCLGCGICAAVCPTGAFEAASPTNTELLDRIEELGKTIASIRFACPKVKGGAEEVIRVSCLGRLDASILLGAVARGVREIELVNGACHDCANGIGHKVAVQAIADSKELAGAFGITARISFVTALPSEAVPAEPSSPADAVSRRAFFDRLVRETTRAAAVTTATVLDAGATANPAAIRGEMPTRLPLSRRLLLDSLKRLGQPVLRDGATCVRLAATFNITPSCSGCRMCALFCPTGALRRVDEDGKAGLTFSSAYCTNCGLCREICYRQSVNLDSHVDLTKIVNEAVDVAWVSSSATTDDEKVKRLLQAIQGTQPRQSSLRGA